MPPNKPTKAPARGRRKSIVDSYKAKARGKKTSKKNVPAPNSKKVKELERPKYTPVLSMTIGGDTFSEGDMAWYVMEPSSFTKRPRQGEIKECYPLDRIEPSVCVWDLQEGKFRTIRHSLIAWSKVEAKKKWEIFLDKNPDLKTT